MCFNCFSYFNSLSASDNVLNTRFFSKHKFSAAAFVTGLQDMKYWNVDLQNLFYLSQTVAISLIFTGHTNVY